MTEPRRTSSRPQSWIAALFALLWLAPAAGAAVVQDILLGDTLVANLSSSGVDNVGARFDAVAGTQASISVRADRGSGLVPTVVLKDDAGSEIPLGSSLVSQGSSVTVRNFELSATGSYVFEIRAVSGSGTVRAQTRGRFPSSYTLSGDFPGPDVSFDVVAGSTLRAQVTAERGSGYEPTIESVTDDGGPLTLVSNVARGSRASFRSALATGGGTALLSVGGSGAGSYTARVRVRAPRSKRTLDLTSLSFLFGAVSGDVTNSVTAAPLAGATVSLDPPVPGVSIATDATGRYADVLPAGVYTLTFASTNFESETQTVSVLANRMALADAALDPVAKVVLGASTEGEPTPGGTMTATTPITILDGSTVISTQWTKVSGPPVDIDDAGDGTAEITLPDASALKETLIAILQEPPIAEEDLPEGIELPEEGFVGGLQDRFQVVAIDPFSLEEAAVVVLEVEVTTSSDTYTDEVEIHVEPFPYKRALGIRNVPLDIPVILHGKDQASYDWALTGVPDGSGAALADPLTQNPDFTPDVEGLYTVQVTDLTGVCDTEDLECVGGPNHGEVCIDDDDCSPNPVTLEIYAGTWRGVIVGQDGDGRPEWDSGCAGFCHAEGGIAPDKFTPWAQTGHAEIFTDRLNAGSYSTSCFGCHTVGFEPDVANGGLDDAADYAAFDTELRTLPAGDKWTTMLAEYSDTAQLANIQCENCHGPQDAAPGVGSGAHGPFFPEGEPRVSLSSDACAYCHGEPLRHARFQQWQLSPHANYALAVDEGTDEECSRCHTANGFLAWMPALTDDNPFNDQDEVEVDWERDEIHPQTCVACHDPHAIGTTTGIDTNATVRISGSTPNLLGGFRAFGVGRGALCMTCHNSRRGERNDSTWEEYAGTSEAVRGPHGSAQADVLMGENAYLVETGVPGKHVLVLDTCVNCHMERTPPPADLSYQLGGTNHTFLPSEAICEDCHGTELNAELVQGMVDGNMADLKAAIEEGWLGVIAQLTSLGYTIDLDQDGDGDIFDESDVLDLEFVPGSRQEITVVTEERTFEEVRLDRVDVLDSGDSVLGQLYEYAPDVLPKAGWNLTLIERDGSHGVHNPSFARDALVAGIEALLAAPLEM